MTNTGVGTDGEATREADNDAQEAFTKTVEVIRKAKRRSWASRNLWVVSALAVLVIAGGWGLTWGMLWLIVTLAFHEGGHWLAMRAFGYQDVRVFLVPFIGGAASGRKQRAPAWQHGLVSLAGPLPGIVVATSIFWFAEPGGQVWGLAEIMLFLNLLNLLPLEPLDGGRLVGRLLFSRVPILDAVFHALGGVGLAWMGFLLDSYILIAFGVFMLMVVGSRWLVASAAKEFARKEPSLVAALPDELGDADETTLRSLYQTIVQRSGRGAKTERSPNNYAALMQGVHQQALLQPPSLSSTLALGAAYALAFLIGAFGYVGYGVRAPPEGAPQSFDAPTHPPAAVSQVLQSPSSSAPAHEY